MEMMEVLIEVWYQHGFIIAIDDRTMDEGAPHFSHIKVCEYEMVIYDCVAYVSLT